MTAKTTEFPNWPGAKPTKMVDNTCPRILVGVNVKLDKKIFPKQPRVLPSSDPMEYFVTHDWQGVSSPRD